MTEQIIDSKFRVLESLPELAGRQRFLVSDLITGRMAVLECAVLEDFERVQKQWAQWQPALRERAAVFAALGSFVPASTIGAWTPGPYYVYEDDSEASLQGRTPARLPALAHVRSLLEDIVQANAAGESLLNLRPEHLRVEDDKLQILPGAYVLPLELLHRSSVRSPYQAPELRYGGLLGPTTDGYLVAGVLQAIAAQTQEARPEWWQALLELLALEPWQRPALHEVLARFGEPEEGTAPRPVRRATERLTDLGPRPAAGASGSAVLESLDLGLARMSEGRSTLLLVEGPASGAGLQEFFLALRESLALLAERPHVARVDALTSWELRDLVGRGPTLLLVPDWRPDEPEILPLDRLLASDKLHPAVFVVGVRAGTQPPVEAEPAPELMAWLATKCSTEMRVIRHVLHGDPPAPPAEPTSPGARRLLDLFSILAADATGEMLRLAIPQEEADLPEALSELESLGHVRRGLEAGGWWGTDPSLVLRVLRPDALELRRQGLSAHRCEELHLLVSHLLENVGGNALGQRYLRFHHLFAGGAWDAAAAECGPLLRWVERRGLDTLMRALQRRLVNSNLAQHFTVPHLLEVLGSLGKWEVGRNRVAEGQGYYERAAEKLFALSDTEVSQLDLAGISDMLLAHADLLERHGEFERALELLQRYLDRFGERIPAVERGRLFSEMGFCENKLGRFVAAEERCQVAQKLLDPRRHPQDVAQVYSILGLVRWKTSRYEEAEQYFNSSLALREKSGDRLAIARIYNNLGLLYRSQRRFPEALEYHRRSMEIRQELGDETGVARLMLNLAWVYFEMRDLERAEELAERAHRQSDQLGSRALRAASKGLLGEIFLVQERMPEARAALDEAIREARAVGDTAELFMDLRKQASLELHGGELGRAEALLDESERYLPHAGSPLEEAHWYLTHAELRQAQGEERAAALSYEHAGNNLARVGHAQRAAEVFLSAARLYHTGGAAARARDLVGRARHLYAREGAVVPKDLVDLEVTVGEGERRDGDSLEIAGAVEGLLRVCASAAAAVTDRTALEQMLGEMRTASGARCALLVDSDGEPHAASVLSRELSEQGVRVADLVRARPRLLARAVRALLPLGSEDLHDDEVRAPFYVIPVEAREHGMGCVYLEWSEGCHLPPEGALRVLRSQAQVLALVLERAARPVPEPRAEGAAAATVARDEGSLESIVGKGATRQAAVEFVRQVRDLDTTVLLLGENGTGKEVVSRAIHFTGSRRGHPFVTVNCTAIPATLWEREFFGHERGAFTDAHESKAGHFETAHKGTLLLDEIGDMPLEMQARFLRVLEDKAFTRIGGTESRRVDVRIIAATNQDLEAAVQAGRFRRDLYHRLNVLSITLPPLRERREDITLLAEHFLNVHAPRLDVQPKRLSGEAQRVLLRYAWPGNVRELENAMKTSLVLSSREVLLPEDLPAAILRGADGTDIAGQQDLETVARWVLEHAGYSETSPLLDSLEKALCRELVGRTGEKSRAARLLGISRPTLYDKLRD